jgi:hypothetical protein
VLTYLVERILSMMAANHSAARFGIVREQRGDSGVLVFWLAMWALSVSAFAVKQWWVIAFCAANFWFLT